MCKCQLSDECESTLYYIIVTCKQYVILIRHNNIIHTSLGNRLSVMASRYTAKVPSCILTLFSDNLALN